MHRVLIRSALVVGAAVLAGCTRSGEQRHVEQVVDSVVPREVALERFRRGLPPVASLSGGAASSATLVAGFIRALESRDTAALRRLVMSQVEFGWLYYPTSPLGLPPYDLSPELMWFQMEGRSRQGLAHALDVRGGRPLGYLGFRCEGDARMEGENRIWGPCLIRRLQAPGDTVEERLFGPIIQRGAVFKFVSYANAL